MYEDKGETYTFLFSNFFEILRKIYKKKNYQIKTDKI